MLLSFVTETLSLPLPAHLASSEQEAPAIDVIRVGTFTDMNKRVVTITADDLDALIRNHEANVAGQDVPVDVDHRRQEAAGWIVRFFREGDVLRAVPRWNGHGVRLVGEQMYRYISATLNLAQKAIISVSLTNFPAVKNLAPIALSAFPAEGEDPTQETDEVFLLFTTERNKAMSMNQAGQDQPGADQNTATAPITPPATPAPAASAAAPAAPAVDLTAELAAVRTAMQEQLSQALVQFRTELTQAAALSEQQRLAIIQDVVNGMREEQAVADFAQAVTSTGRHALPTRAETLRQQLLGIPQPHRTTVMEILRTIHGSGTVDFSETGTSQGNDRQLLSLDAAMTAALSDFREAGGTVEKFFELNNDLLGPQSAYDLRAFTAAA